MNNCWGKVTETKPDMTRFETWIETDFEMDAYLYIIFTWVKN